MVGCENPCPKCDKHDWNIEKISGQFYKFTCNNDGYWKFVAPESLIKEWEKHGKVVDKTKN